MKRKMRGILIALFWIMAICGCTKPGSREDELAYLRTILPDSLLDYSHLEIASVKSVAIIGNGENQYLGLHVFPGQSRVNNGIRAEVSVDYPYEPGETIRYSWRFMLPNDFVSDGPRNRWWLIGQWHDQPNPKLGETWRDFPSHSPPVMIGLGEVDGRLSIGLSYGPTPSQNLGPLTVERGKWHNIAVILHWSRGPEGKAVVFLDDLTVPAITAEGPNMHNDYHHYLKLGMYRHPEISTDNWIYMDDIQISKSANP